MLWCLTDPGFLSLCVPALRRHWSAAAGPWTLSSPVPRTLCPVSIHGYSSRFSIYVGRSSCLALFHTVMSDCRLVHALETDLLTPPACNLRCSFSPSHPSLLRRLAYNNMVMSASPENSSIRTGSIMGIIRRYRIAVLTSSWPSRYRLQGRGAYLDHHPLRPS